MTLHVKLKCNVHLRNLLFLEVDVKLIDRCNLIAKKVGDEHSQCGVCALHDVQKLNKKVRQLFLDISPASIRVFFTPWKRCFCDHVVYSLSIYLLNSSKAKHN